MRSPNVQSRGWWTKGQRGGHGSHSTRNLHPNSRSPINRKTRPGGTSVMTRSHLRSPPSNRHFHANGFLTTSSPDRNLPCETTQSNGSSSDEGSYNCISRKKGEKNQSNRNLLRYKTELCRSFEECGICKFGVGCTFAHGLVELRAVPRHPRYKTEQCRAYHADGYCQYGTRCHFVHDMTESPGVSPAGKAKCHDRQSFAMLALADDMGLPSTPDTSDILLTNLRRLCALRKIDDSVEIDVSSNPDVSEIVNRDVNNINVPDELSNKIAPQPDGASKELSDVLSDDLASILLECESPPSRDSIGSSCRSIGYDASLDHTFETSADTSINISTDTGLWSSMWSVSSLAVSPPEDSWNVWASGSVHSSSSSDIGVGCDLSAYTAPPPPTDLVSNPFEISRGLQFPSLNELCNK